MKYKFRFNHLKQDVEERARMLKLRMGQNPAYSISGTGSAGPGGGGVRSWRMYSGHSDNDLPPQRSHSTASTSSRYVKAVGRTGRSLSGADGGKLLSPDRAPNERAGTERAGGGDSDVESLVSFVSGTSALSTQSERASAYVKRGYVAPSFAKFSIQYNTIYNTIQYNTNSCRQSDTRLSTSMIKA